MGMQVSRSSYLDEDTQLPSVHKSFAALSLDTQGESFLNFYLKAAAMKKAVVGESGLPRNVHYLYCTTTPQAETQYKNKVKKIHQQVKLVALEQLKACMPEIAKIVKDN